MASQGAHANDSTSNAIDGDASGPAAGRRTRTQDLSPARPQAGAHGQGGAPGAADPAAPAGPAAPVHAPAAPAGPAGDPFAVHLGAPIPIGPATITGQGVLVRATPDTAGARVGGALARGTYVQVLSSDATWSRIRHGADEGHVQSRYLAPVTRGADEGQVVEREALGLMATSESSGRAGHYTGDSHRTNIGLGSWTGGRIGTLLRRYEAAAQEHGQLAELHAHFGGAAHWADLIRRFTDRAELAARDGDWHGSRLTPEEIQQFESAEHALPFIREADEAQLHGDFTRYLHLIARLHPPWPYVDVAGTISQLAMEVMTNVAHQSGDGGFTHLVQSLIGGDQRPGGEVALLHAIAEAIIGRVSAGAQRGVRARYDRLFARYGDSPRRIALEGAH